MGWNEETAMEILKEAIRAALGFRYACLPEQVNLAIMASMSNYFGSSQKSQPIISGLPDPIQVTLH